MNKSLLYACIEKNIGDDLFIYTICKRYPNHIFYISSEAKYGALKDIENLRFSYIFNIWQKASNIGNRKGLKLLLSKVVARICSIYLKRFDTSIYVVGNAFKCYQYRDKMQSEWFRQRMMLTKNFFLLSTNFGPFDNNQWLMDFKKHFSKITQVCFRDEVSYSLFKELKNADWAPDVVLSNGAIPYNKHVGEKQVLISIIDCDLESRPENMRNYTDDYENKIVEICNYYLEKNYLVKILTSNNEQDYPAAKRIQNKCYVEIKKQPSIVEYEGDYHKVFEEYQKTDFVIATRLHAIILGWLYQLPVMPIIYDIKVKTLLESYGFDSLSIDLELINELSIKEMDDALNNYEFSNLENLYKASNQQFEMLDKMLV